MIDTYLIYCAWFQQTYNRPFNVSREFFYAWLARPYTNPPEQLEPDSSADVQFDYDKEREGDAQ